MSQRTIWRLSTVFAVVIAAVVFSQPARHPGNYKVQGTSDPYGPVSTFDAFSPSNSNAAIRAIKKTPVTPIVRPLSAAFTATTGGSGVGTKFWLTLFDTTAGSSICDAGFDCGLGGALTQSANCSGLTPTTAGGNSIEVRIDCTTCDASGCPIGNATFQLQTQ